MTEGTKSFTTLDGWIDLSKHIATVIFAVSAAIAAMIGIGVNQFFWALVLMGGAIVYSLYLPYKAAILVKGDWGFIARVRVAQTLLAGIPTWGILVFYLIFNPSILPLVPSYLLDSSVEEISNLFFIVIFVVSTSTIFIMSFSINHLLRIVGYSEEDSKHLARYLNSRGRKDIVIVAFIVFYAVSFIVSGLLVRETLDDSLLYFTYGLVYLIMLIIFGFFSVAYVPERCDNTYRIMLEILIILIVLVSPVQPLISASFFLVLLVITLALTWMNPEIDIKSIIEKEDQEFQELLQSRPVQYLARKYEKYNPIYQNFHNKHLRKIKYYMRFVLVAFFPLVLLYRALAIPFLVFGVLVYFIIAGVYIMMNK